MDKYCERSYKNRGVVFCRVSKIECIVTKQKEACSIDKNACKMIYFIGIDAYCHRTKATCDTTKKRGSCKK